MPDPAPNGLLAPPDGYWYQDPILGRKIVGSSWADLAERVRQARTANRKPPGDPLPEIFNQFCSRYPVYCKRGAQVVSRSTLSSSILLTRVAGWISGVFAALYRKSPVTTRRANVEARIAACRTCAHQQEWRGSCRGCSISVVSLWGKAMKLAGAKSSGLLGCNLFGEDTDLSVWLEQPARVEPAAPKHCWRTS